MLKTILSKTRNLTYIAVIFILVCAISLYLLTTVATIVTVFNAVTSEGWDVYSIREVAASFLKVVDFFLLSVGLHIIAVGVYKLFIDASIELPEAMNARSFVDLKLTLVKLATIVLLLEFVEQALSSHDPRELLEFGIAIAVVLAAVSWGARQLATAADQAH